jgi:hypothetical protein
MFLPGQRVLYDLKPRHIGVIRQIEIVRGTERVNYLIKYSDERLLVHAEGHRLKVLR